jgi:hypothetical protein
VQQEGIEAPRASAVGHQGGQHPQEGGAGRHAPAEPLDGFGAVPHLLARDHHGAIAQMETPPGERLAQRRVRPAIADPQAGNARPQLAELGEMAAERAPPVKHQDRGREVVPIGGVEVGRMEVRWIGHAMPAVSPVWGIGRGRRGIRRTLQRLCSLWVGWIRGALSGAPGALDQRVARPLACLLAGLVIAGSLFPPAWRGLALVPPALAVTAIPPRAYLCDGDPLTAELVRGPLDDPTIPDPSAAPVPVGGWVVLHWRDLNLQLPRTNNAGQASFSDGKWWWSLEDPEHPRFRLRQPLGEVRDFACEATS